MLVRIHSGIRTTSLALLYPSYAMSSAPNSTTSSFIQAEKRGSVSAVSLYSEQGSGAARSAPRRKLVNQDLIFKRLGLTKRPLHHASASCNTEDPSLSGSKNIISATNTLEEVGDLTSKLPITCSEQSDPGRDCSSLSMSPSTNVLSEPRCTDQVSEESVQKDEEFLHDSGCTDLLEGYCLPASFGKKQSSQSRNPNSENHSIKHVAGSRNKKSKSHGRWTSVEQFDICLTELEAMEAKSSETGDFVFLRSPPDVENPANELEGNMQIKEPIQRVLRPGMVLLKKYISPSEQVSIVQTCRKLGLGPGGFYRPGYKDGAKLRLHMMCLGLDWDPQTRKYQKRRQIDRAKPPDIPDEFHLLVDRAMQDSLSHTREEYKVCNAEKILPCMSPDVCIINFYTETGRLGLHQDRDESVQSLSNGLPVVSFSVGDSAEFLYGDQRDVKKAQRLVLESGDVLVFGGDSRLIFHGISSILPDSAPEFLRDESRLRPGRINLTFRQY